MPSHGVKIPRSRPFQGKAKGGVPKRASGKAKLSTGRAGGASSTSARLSEMGKKSPKAMLA